jgi:hypothetical protein
LESGRSFNRFERLITQKYYQNKIKIDYLEYNYNSIFDVLQQNFQKNETHCQSTPDSTVNFLLKKWIYVFNYGEKVDECDAYLI